MKLCHAVEAHKCSVVRENLPALVWKVSYSESKQSHEKKKKKKKKEEHR